MQNQIQRILQLDRLPTYADISLRNIDAGNSHRDVGKHNQNTGSADDHHAQIRKQRKAYLVIVSGHQSSGKNDVDCVGEDGGINGRPAGHLGALLGITGHNRLHHSRANAKDCIADDVTKINQGENPNTHTAHPTAKAKIKHGKDTDRHDKPSNNAQGAGTSPFTFKAIAPNANQRVCNCVKDAGAGDDSACHHRCRTVDTGGNIAGKGHQNNKHCRDASRCRCQDNLP